MPRPGRFTPGKTRYPLYKRLGGPQGRSGQVWKISLPTGITSPDRPARSESLYRLSYPGPLKTRNKYCIFCVCVFEALVIQQAMRMRHIVVGAVGLYHIFPHYL